MPNIAFQTRVYAPRQGGWGTVMAHRYRNGATLYGVVLDLHAGLHWFHSEEIQLDAPPPPAASPMPALDMGYLLDLSRRLCPALPSLFPHMDEDDLTEDLVFEILDAALSMAIRDFNDSRARAVRRP